MLSGGADLVSQGVNADALLAFHDLRCLRDGRELFDGLSLELLPGQVCMLLGANGSGKSTLLRCVAGLYAEFDGTVHSTSAQYLGHRVALSPGLSVTRNLEWFAALAATDPDLDILLERVGMAGYGPVAVGNLSAGQQRRVALARLLVVAAPLWLLDEPYTALDSAGHALVDRMIDAHCAAGGAVLCATHQTLGCRVDHTLTLGAVTP